MRFQYQQTLRDSLNNFLKEYNKDRRYKMILSKSGDNMLYADKLNVSTAYLSRLVKEISGSTVNDHVSSLLYKEICNLLKQSDMTMGEIADSLHFSDQSALSNFFKLRSGMSPLAYRNQ